LIKTLNVLEYYLKQPKIVLYLSISVLIYYLAPYFIHGQNLYISAYDNLDSTVVMNKILAQSGMIFADSNAIVPNMMGGLPRHTYGSEFSVILWLYYFFSPFTAYVINDVFMHLVAFGSMWLFLRRHVFAPVRNNILIIATGSLYFAIIPYWGGAGISVPAIPLVVYAFLNIRNKNSTWLDWAILVLIPFYSSFILVYFFVLLLAGLYWIFDSIRKKNFQWQFFCAIALMTAVFLLVEYRLIYSTFIHQDFVSHRSEFAVIFANPALQCYRLAMLNFLNGAAWVKGNHYQFLLPLMVLALLVSLRRGRYNLKDTFFIISIFGLAFAVELWGIIFRGIYFAPVTFVLLVMYILWKREENKQLAWIIIGILVIALEGGFWFYEGLKPLDEKFPFLHSFNMSRFAFIEPFLWALAATYTVWIIQKKLRYSAVIIYLFMAGILYVAVHNSLFQYEEKNSNTYKNYYATGIFDQIQDYIAKPQSSYRIASIGIVPAIPLYNNFYTIDGYSPNYPLEYKHKFEKIFEKERSKNSTIDGLFHNWGSKCYVFTHNTMFEQKNTAKNLIDIELNTTVMRQLGAQYLITPVKIPNPQSQLRYHRSFTEGNAYWMVYLYEILPDNN